MGLFFDFTTAILPGAITFTRAGANATYINNSGILTIAGANVARFNYDPTGSTLLGLLIEPAATNLLLQSNNFTTTWFAQNSAVATAAQFTSPDNTNDGWSVTSGTGFGAVAQLVTVTATTYAFSVWCKRITGTAPMNFQWAGNSWGAFTTSTTLTRFTGTGTSTAGAANMSLQVNAASGNTNGMFGAQLETGSVATSYIVTTTGTATRNADVATFTIPSDVNTLIYKFDDSSTQAVSVAPGSYTIPTNLNRPNILSITGPSNLPFMPDMTPGTCVMFKDL